MGHEAEGHAGHEALTSRVDVGTRLDAIEPLVFLVPDFNRPKKEKKRVYSALVYSI